MVLQHRQSHAGAGELHPARPHRGASSSSDEFLELLRDINEPLEPFYRYDTGTSAAAAAVSGLLALMQEFFERQLERPYSPALMKALLINGARSLSSHLQPRGASAGQLPGLGAARPHQHPPRATLTNQLDQPEDVAAALDRPEPHQRLGHGRDPQLRRRGLTTNAMLSDLRVTLVWTDPPGNPAASIKLVNDLDLVVSNRTTGVWYLGNDIPASSDYNRCTRTNETVGLSDNINNVENVFLRRPIDTNYTVFVTARRVNVNAVTAHTNAVVQDYALVVSVGGTNALPFTPQTLLATNLRRDHHHHQRRAASSTSAPAPIRPSSARAMARPTSGISTSSRTSSTRTSSGAKPTSASTSRSSPSRRRTSRFPASARRATSTCT